ncbi:DnaJ-like protein subfamily C member 16 [Acromyrmex echinatior]|uniref:DnaJ-like protein subfamily C member 16 n=1 Tax=Acromyrmex echinatior TaxID=103372 RepID=F4WL68_ACREC|nr:DnaJ-like protein subfamily C member 16 [Acromyrmex echinatior]
MMLSIDFLMTGDRQTHGDVARVASVVPLMRYMFLLLSLFALLQLTLPAAAGDSLGDPYKILGVSKHATLQDIRKAYKHLVKEWHPDKTDHPMAEDKFVEITKAYELLTDPERRRKFDNHGITEEGIPRQRRDNSHFNVLDPLEELFTGNFKFHYQSRDITLFHKMSITYRSFENVIVPKTYRMPYLILFYSDWCYMCLQAEPTWRRLIDELEPLGLEFVRSRLPYKLISTINNNNVENFLSGWTDNRIRALIFEKRNFIRLRYLLTSFYYRDRVAFGFVQISVPETKNITSKYKISGELDTLLLFNENSEKPMASVSMKDISSETMHNVIANNKFLLLPRLSNQAMLDSICPPEWLRPQKRLCAVLISQQNNPLHDIARHKFRQAALESSYSTERVRYAYVFKDTQPEFVSALSAGEGSPLEPLLHIVIIWRRDANHLKYEWFPHGWLETIQNERIWNETRRHLEKTIQRLLRTTEALPYSAVVGELADEHAQGTVDRLIGRALLAVDYISDNLTKEQILPLISVLITLMLIGVAGYGMSYLVKLEEASVQSEHVQCKDNIKSLPSQPQLRLHELRVEKYYGLVRLLKPGCRTIVLLVDAQSRLKLLPAFHKAVWPYRKNKTLMFAHLSLERGLDWYKKLLSLVLSDQKELNINIKNCVGTVLSLNGHRKYFCMYHAKHPECTKGKSSKRMEKMTKQLAKKSEDPETGAFIGFDSSNESDQDEGGNMLYQDLLDGLPMWLERLFEGLTQRYYINYWPEFTAK